MSSAPSSGSQGLPRSEPLLLWAGLGAIVVLLAITVAALHRPGGAGEPVVWDTEHDPLVVPASAEGAEALVGRFRTRGWLRDRFWIGGFDPQLRERWRLPLDGPEDDPLLAVSGPRLLVVRAQEARPYDARSGQTLGGYALTAAPRRVCGSPQAPAAFYLELDEGEGLVLIEGAGPRPSPRPSWCPPGPAGHEGDCAYLHTHARVRTRCESARTAPLVAGLRARWVLREGDLAVVLGEKVPGPGVPMGAGFDPATGEVRWARLLPAIDPSLVREEPAYLAELAQGTLHFAYAYKDAARGWRLQALDARTGQARWDNEVPGSDLAGGPESLVITPSRIYVPVWTWLDVLDARTGARLGRIGGG